VCVVGVGYVGSGQFYFYPYSVLLGGWPNALFLLIRGTCEGVLGECVAEFMKAVEGYCYEGCGRVLIVMKF
jgi:hypothetical protein